MFSHARSLVFRMLRVALVTLTLLALTPAALAKPVRIEDYIPVASMGDRNTLHELQNYVASLSPQGLVLRPDGSLDLERSFTKVDYFSLLTGARVRNNVQASVGNHPVDFVALRVPCAGVTAPDGDARADACMWMTSGEAQALLLSRTDAGGRVQLRYLPVAKLAQDASGGIRFEQRPWSAGLPLRIWEDPLLVVPAPARRDTWLGEWHADDEWLAALHRTRYSNGLVGLHEQLAPHSSAALDVTAAGLDQAERLRRRYRARQRSIVEPDLLIMAADHWNFDVRGFNPGGNHGSFFRASTHATLMVAGGAATGIARGRDVETPYDSLSFVPTLLALTGRLEDDNQPDAPLRARGFTRFPGRVIRELVDLSFSPDGPVPDGD
jgi:hypothetical protein